MCDEGKEKNQIWTSLNKCKLSKKNPHNIPKSREMRIIYIQQIMLPSPPFTQCQIGVDRRYIAHSKSSQTNIKGID